MMANLQASSMTRNETTLQPAKRWEEMFQKIFLWTALHNSCYSEGKRRGVFPVLWICCHWAINQLLQLLLLFLNIWSVHLQ